jgi:hypothetical protein
MSGLAAAVEPFLAAKDLASAQSALDQPWDYISFSPGSPDAMTGGWPGRTVAFTISNIKFV